MRFAKEATLFAIILAAAVLLAAGCGAEAKMQNTAQAPAGMSGTQGVITQVSANSVTIAVMPQGAGTGNQPPAGSFQPAGSGAPPPQPQASGTAPQGGQPNGQTPVGMAAPDTSSWQKMTFTIDSQTKIVQGQAPGSGAAAAKTLTAGDLKAGDSVSIEARSGQTSVAGQITVTQGMGGNPGGQGGPAPTASAKS